MYTVEAKDSPGQEIGHRGEVGRSLVGAGMNRTRIVLGLSVWLLAGAAFIGWLRSSVLAPETLGHQVADDLWQFAVAERRQVQIQLDASLPIDVGDPIYQVTSPQSVEQIGEVRRIVQPASDPPVAGETVLAEVLLYPHAPVVCQESYLLYYSTPTSLTWVMETMLPESKRAQIAEEILGTYQSYHAEILQALRPVIIGGLTDAMNVVEEDLANALADRRELLDQLGSRYQDRVVEQELVPLVRDQVWPIVKKHGEPLANQIGAEIFERASLWRFGWRALYDKSFLPAKDLTLTEWNRFVKEEAIPVLDSHTEDFVKTQRLIFEEVSHNEIVQEALQRNLSQVIDDPEFRQIVWSIFREVVVDNARLRQKLEERWRGAEAQRAMQLAADYVEPCVRRIGDLLLGTRETGISPEFAQVLRNQILDKDCRWLVLETPAGARPIDKLSSQSRLFVRDGGYPDVNPFAIQLQGGRP